MARAYPKEFVLRFFRSMYLIRRFEERAAQAYGQAKINGFCHLYIGQEAVAVGHECPAQWRDCCRSPPARAW